MQNIYKIVLIDNLSRDMRDEIVEAKDVYDAHKQAYFRLAQSTEEVESIMDTSTGQQVYSEDVGFLEEQLF
jgi:hypothetical protein